MEKEKQNSPCCTDFEYDSCDVKTDLQTSHKISNSTQTEKISDKQVQTIEDPIRCKSEKRSLKSIHATIVMLTLLQKPIHPAISYTVNSSESNYLW